MNIEDFSLEDLKKIEAEIQARKVGKNSKKIEEHHGFIDTLTHEQLHSVEREISSRIEGYNNVDAFLNHGFVDNLSDKELASLEAEIRTRIDGYNRKEIHEHYGSVEHLSNAETASKEAEIKARMAGYNSKEIHEHYGSVEHLSDAEIASKEAEIKARMIGYNSRNEFQHHGSVENLDDSTISIMEAQVAEQRRTDIPFNEYFDSLIENPEITDEGQFKEATIRSMQSNKVMRNFVEKLCDKVGEKAFQLKKTDINDKEQLESVKQEIEKMVSVYVKYMYTLKENDWDFRNDINDMSMPEYITENLWQQQRRLDTVFAMPIPVNLGEEYGNKFQRDGKMVPGLQFMKDHLSGKQVNWHQLMISKEKIMPSDAAKNALKEGITEDKVNEAKTIENKEIEMEKNEEGVSLDD